MGRQGLTDRLASQNPLVRAGLPRDVAYAALYLASDEASHIDGLDLVVDGGMMAGHQTDYRQTSGHS